MALTVGMAAVLAPSVAEACGGCFVGGETESTVVTGHRMAMAISQTQSVLWDQFDYAGDPAEFAWVLPIKPGARVEVAQDALFDVLDAGTSVSVGSRLVPCSSGGSGFGCGDADGLSEAGGEYGSNDPVTVVSQSTVGPYETVTLSTEQPGALNEWLVGHGYNVPSSIQPTIDAYVAEGFDFIALRLIPGNGVQQMQPVRVVMPAGQMTLPLRLVGAGTGAQTAITLFVISEGRYQVQNFPNLSLNRDGVVWDFATSSSNYRALRAAVLKKEEGLGWLTAYARKDTLLLPTNDNSLELGGQLSYQTPVNPGTFGGESVVNAQTMASAYLFATADNRDAALACGESFWRAARQGLRVVDNCDADGNCAPLAADEISTQELRCSAEADDLAVALTGMRASDVWITRLEADLPRAAFERDLVLEASSDQSELDSRFVAPSYINSPCGPSVGLAGLAGASQGQGRSGRLPSDLLVALTLGALGVALVLRRPSL